MREYDASDYLNYRPASLLYIYMIRIVSSIQDFVNLFDFCSTVDEKNR